MTKTDSSFGKQKTVLRSAGKAHRNPMLLFVFDGALFQFDAQRPLLEPLFQLPPEYSPRERAKKSRSAPPFHKSKSLHSFVLHSLAARRTGNRYRCSRSTAHPSSSMSNGRCWSYHSNDRRNTAREPPLTDGSAFPRIFESFVLRPRSSLARRARRNGNRRRCLRSTARDPKPTSNGRRCWSRTSNYRRKTAHERGNLRRIGTSLQQEIFS